MKLLPLIVIRPEPGNAATIAAARERGLHAIGYPLFRIEPTRWSVAEGRFEAILAGSANIFRHGGPQLDALKHLPVIAVGEATASAARTAGFTVVRTGEGGLQPVVETLAPGTYLRLAGEDRVTLAPPPGVRIETAVVYAARPVPLPDELVAVLARPAVVLLHSGAAAKHFRQQCERTGITRESLYLACLAPRIAALAGDGWGDLRIADSRTDSDLLELGRRMCQTM